MKKTISILLILSTFLFVLSGCFNTTQKEKGLAGTNAKDFYKVLCEVAEVEEKEPRTEKNLTIYESQNETYNIKVEANSDNEINKITITCLSDVDYENVFLALSRLEYEESDRAQAYNWIHSNIKNNTIKFIGKAKFDISKDKKQIILKVY